MMKFPHIPFFPRGEEEDAANVKEENNPRKKKFFLFSKKMIKFVTVRRRIMGVIDDRRHSFSIFQYFFSFLHNVISKEEIIYFSNTHTMGRRDLNLIEWRDPSNYLFILNFFVVIIVSFFAHLQYFFSDQGGSNMGGGHYYSNISYKLIN